MLSTANLHPYNKGMLRSAVVGVFYKDLTDPDYETCFCIYHRRFSTNTTPKWPLAQPMRMLAHSYATAVAAALAPPRYPPDDTTIPRRSHA